MSDNDSDYHPSSDDVIIPGFSQRDDTHEETTAHFLDLGRQFEAQQRRREKRAQRPISAGGNHTPRASALAARTEIDHFYQPNEALDSQATSQAWLDARLDARAQSLPALIPGEEESGISALAVLDCSTNDEKELEFELLRLQYYEMEAERNSLKAERDSAQDECTHLAAQCQQLRDALRETQVSLRSFQQETEQRVWASASANTRVQTIMRETGCVVVSSFPIDGR
ncbi:hypothetical protein DFH08DRAFT_880901 [Mycena albidolilacea]|uniref:Uncharacterized protein n=1 Tax=Mycena albidolilacea TaxID=1033008 RepID=A0AAD7EKH5_9AGAR|nr:hypothetical protein DFH08DRAFT_880901 [Mycena albidolilacea]